ncbi:MAG: hypothetical protein IT452_01630 [Planctomycetia bacterium]|nr:hypothetical protein [Planctomycetia bacterium]
MDIATKHAFRKVGAVTVSTGFQANGGEAVVEAVIRRDRLGPGDHLEDIQMELANLLVQALEKRYHPARK